MSKKPELPAPLQDLVDKIGDPVSPSDVDTYAKLKNVLDQSHRVRTIVNAWKKQQDQERDMRGRYAFALIIAMMVQAVIINTIFLLIGCGKLTYEPWTAKVFITAVFAELAAMVFFIVKYLFRPGADKVLELASDPLRPGPSRTTAAKRGKSGDRLS